MCEVTKFNNYKGNALLTDTNISPLKQYVDATTGAVGRNNWNI